MVHGGAGGVTSLEGGRLMAYGTPRTAQDIEGYYTHIRGGRPPSPTELENLAGKVHRHRRHVAPDADHRGSEGQAPVEARGRGSKTRVYSAMKHSPPFISDVVKEAADDGADELLSIALAPTTRRSASARTSRRWRRPTPPSTEEEETEALLREVMARPPEAHPGLERACRRGREEKRCSGDYPGSSSPPTAFRRGYSPRGTPTWTSC